MGKVLFISHNAGRNGAPLMLRNLLRWLKENSTIEFEVLLRSSGPLQEDFAALAPTSVYQSPQLRGRFLPHLVNLTGAAGRLNKLLQQTLVNRFRDSGIDQIYSNTFTNGDILQALAPLDCPVITHVHEMEGWIQQAGKENLEQVLQHTTHFIAASDACSRNLIENHQIAPARIDTVHSFIPLDSITTDPTGIKAKLDIPADAFVVLGSGHEAWRKGKDLFVQLAALLRDKLPDRRTVHFIWVGGWLAAEDERNVQHDVHHLGLADRIHFTGEVANPLDYFAAGDVFALVSREDTFPLVCLEAAALGKPVLCFAGSGGMPEFVEQDAGFVLPYLDLAGMAEKIIDLSSSPEERQQRGKVAAEKVQQRNNIASGSRRIEAIIRKNLPEISPDIGDKL